ncbi:MAG TPA: iron-containing redox enzyme family protein [Candidatus Eisenbacteria bacterium]|nr:iron-containing redox enzyme family protein [Candidatus Eisenbacteria bacterium]
MNPSEFAKQIDRIVARCNDDLEGVRFSKDSLTREAARTLVQQWSIFTRHSRQCWAYVVGNCPIVEVRKFIVTENLYEEEAQEGHSHFEILARMGKALGLTRDEIEHAKPLPSTVIALLAWESLTKNRTWYEGLAAKSVLERTNNPHCGNFSHHQAEQWMRQLGLSREETEFWWMHDSVDQIHGDGSLNLLKKYLTLEDQRQAALRAAEESMMAWKIYFDGFYYEGVRRTTARG